MVAVARSAEALGELAGVGGSSITAVVADVGRDAGIARVVEAVEGVDHIHGVVNAAATLVRLEPYSAVVATELMDHLRVHVAAPLSLYQELAKAHWIERMLFIDSYSATTPRHGWPGYSIVKAAAQMAARCAAQELAETAVIRVFPGAVNTRIVEAVLASGTETATTFAAMLERGEFSEPADVAAFIVALLLDVSPERLAQQEVWDYNDSSDRAAVV